MINKIFKYDLELTDKQTIDLPTNAIILTVQYQHGGLRLWAKVDENTTTRKRKIRIIGTGHEFEGYNWLYITTVQDLEGLLIWHIFEDAED